MTALFNQILTKLHNSTGAFIGLLYFAALLFIMKQYNATVISIGDELLIGQTVNTNATWMGQKLNSIGIKLTEVLTITDEEPAILDALTVATKKADIVLLTGGLGPTKDDITKKTLAQYFNTDLVLNEEILEMLKAYFKKRGRPLLQSTAELAYMPANCKVIFNKKGTAAGMWWNYENTIIVSMPGVPYEMKAMMEERILPRFQKLFKLPAIVHKTIMVAGVGESIVAEKIKTIEENLPEHIKLAYLPRLGVLRLRLSGIGKIEALLNNEIATYITQICALLPNHQYGFDEALLTETLQQQFIAQNLTLATAESCTGGQIAAQIVQIPGSSAYFNGGIVAYSNTVKQNLLNIDAELINKVGAVSKEVVEAMAANVINVLNSDYSIAVSGIAGPTGGSEAKPVGTVWIAVASKTEVYSKMYCFPLQRANNILLTANYGLYMLWRLVNG